jgi:dihydrofolate reductase
MRELVVDLFTSLDGFAKGERSPAFFGYLGPDLARWIDGEGSRPEVLLMGRVTYQLLADVSLAQQDEAGRRMTDQPKIVFSRTLQEPLPWANTQLVASDAADAVRTLKDQPGERLRVIGSLSLVRGLLTGGVVDRLRLMVFPVLLGATGREPAFEGLGDVALELVGQDVLDDRLVLLEYCPA